jgi:predicted ribosome quality control (RQC) complex YloA/Tae2 family protein
MLSLRELRRAARIINDTIQGATLRRAEQAGGNTLILSFEKFKSRRHILLSASTEDARICAVEEFAEPTSSVGSFCEYVRAHLIGGTLAGVDVSESDRQISLTLRTRSSSFVLILSILGARSNIYLLDMAGKLVHSMRPLHDTRHELMIGEAWTNARGSPPSEGIDRWEGTADAFFLEIIGQAYQQLEQKQEAERLARRMMQAIKKEQVFLNRKCVNLQEDLGAALKAEEYRHKGELLKGVLHAIRKGSDRIAVRDYQTGEDIEIELDPKISPAANLESYFARYQKETRGIKVIQQQLEDLETARIELDRAAHQVEDKLKGAAPDLQALEKFAAQPLVRRLLHRRSSPNKPAVPLVKPASKHELPARLRPKRYKTQDGLEIWVGRNDEGNDYLTTRLARGNDLFFHLEGYPGSHVVLRTEGHRDAPPGSLLDACELALHFSKLKNAGHADIHVAPIKDVKKPKGAKPGLVFVRSGRTVHLRRDARRLQNILANRLDE